MKKRNNQGFTIAELAIVIAVIAILAAVLVPSFSGIVEKTERSTSLKLAEAAYKEARANAFANDDLILEGEMLSAGGFTFVFAQNGASAHVAAYPEQFAYTLTVVQDEVHIIGEQDNPPASSLPSQGSVSVTGISLYRDSLTLVAGQRELLHAYVEPAYATNKVIDWQSSDPSVATVENGYVTAVAEGVTLISATITDGDETFMAGCALTVNRVRVSYISLNKLNLALTVGADEVLTANVQPDDIAEEDKQVLWESDKPEIATVDETGKVTAVAPGYAVIKATAGNVYAICSVLVSPAEDAELPEVSEQPETSDVPEAPDVAP